MKKTIILLALLVLSTSAFSGERWIAKCTDGNSLHYVQKYKGTGHLFVEVKNPQGENILFPIATLKQSKSTAVSICGTVLGNSDPQGHPISQVCMNRERQIVYIKFDHPKKDGSEPVKEGEFCKADVKVFSDL